MSRKHPIVWVIGATRSCKTPLSEIGIVPLGFKLMSTGDYFRQRYGKKDTFSRDFVFQISAFAAGCLKSEPDCHLVNLDRFVEQADQPCVIEGQRNPIEFAKYYDPQKDMVIFLHRTSMDIYDTTIEKGIPVIEDSVRWCINNGITPPTSAFKVQFNHATIKAFRFGTTNLPDTVFFEGAVPQHVAVGAPEDRYPWINYVIGLVREQVASYFGADIRPTARPAPEAAAAQPAPNT